MPEDDNLNLKINATILEQVMARIRWEILRKQNSKHIWLGLFLRFWSGNPFQGHAVLWRGGANKNVNCDTMTIIIIVNNNDNCDTVTVKCILNITLVPSLYTLKFNHKKYIFILLLYKTQLTPLRLVKRSDWGQDISRGERVWLFLEWIGDVYTERRSRIHGVLQGRWLMTTWEDLSGDKAIALPCQPFLELLLTGKHDLRIMRMKGRVWDQLTPIRLFSKQIWKGELYLYIQLCFR